MGSRSLSPVKQRWKYVAVDFFTTMAAFFLFNIYRCFLLKEGSDVWSYVFSTKLMIEEILIPAGMSGIYWLSGYYNIPYGKSRLQELITTLFSALIGTIMIYLILLINDQTGERILNYELLGSLLGLLFIFPYIGRLLITVQATSHFREHQWAFRTLIIGNTASARATAKRLSEGNSRVGSHIVGYLAVPGENDVDDGEKVFPLEDVERICREESVDQLVIAGTTYNDKRVLNLLYRLFHIGLPIKIAPDTFSYVTSAIKLQDIYGEPFIDLTSPALSESSKNIKRLTDVVVSILALLLLSPVYGILAVLVKRSSKGPVIYSQERIGLKQRPFNIYKFRTMREDAEKEGPRLAEESDPRVTPLGRVLRKYRLDELPQFWNVLKGEMSLVGPRPERSFFIEQIMKEAPYYALVYQVRPGITSWGMVKYGYASNVREMVERTRFDLIYMSNMSLFVDMKILIYTIKTVFTGRGM